MSANFFFPLKPLKPDFIALFVSSCTAILWILRISDAELAKREFTPPNLLLFESHIIHSVQGDKCILATDRELITLLETPKSVSVYTPKSNI